MSNLPAKSRSKNIQKKHVRRYKTGKISVVNPKNKEVFRYVSKSIQGSRIPFEDKSGSSFAGKRGVVDKRNFKIDALKPSVTVIMPDDDAVYAVPVSAIDFFYKEALIMFFIGWRKRLKDWSYHKKQLLAVEVDKVAGIVPIHLPNFKEDVSTMGKVLEGAGVEFIKYEDDGFMLFDLEDKTLVADKISGLRLYALFVYLVNELSNKCLVDKSGFEFVREAEARSRFF